MRAAEGTTPTVQDASALGGWLVWGRIPDAIET